VALAAPLHGPQLTPADSNAWSSGAWTGLQRSTANPSAWAAGSSAQVGSIPWCPGEPNNKDGSEGCAALVTVCSSSGAALVNDYPCGWPLRVLCAIDAAPECSQAPVQYGWDHSGCTQPVGQQLAALGNWLAVSALNSLECLAPYPAALVATNQPGAAPHATATLR
jgi:hypothetical protein